MNDTADSASKLRSLQEKGRELIEFILAHYQAGNETRTELAASMYAETIRADSAQILDIGAEEKLARNLELYREGLTLVDRHKFSTKDFPELQRKVDDMLLEVIALYTPKEDTPVNTLLSGLGLLLLRAGANPNCVSAEGAPAFRHALEKNMDLVAADMVGRNANTDFKLHDDRYDIDEVTLPVYAGDGRMPFTYAALRRREEVEKSGGRGTP